MRQIIILAVAYFFASIGFTQVISHGRGFADGDRYREFDQDFRSLYIAGIYDGFVFSTVFGGDPKFLRSFGNCFNEMSLAQVTAIVDRFMEGNPELWHKPMNELTWVALAEVCPALRD